MAKDYGDGEPGARGAAVALAIKLPEEAYDFFGEMAATFNRENRSRLTVAQFVEEYLLAIALADKRRDPAITHRLRRRTPT